jgi:hypothetical protein
MDGEKIFGMLMLVLWAFLLTLPVVSDVAAQSKPTYGQQIAVMKILQPDLKIIGVMGSDFSDKEIQDITRAGLGQGTQIIVGFPKDPRDISQIYKKMLSEEKIQIVWIPNVNDDMMIDRKSVV